jgi:hypothetical protein
MDLYSAQADIAAGQLGMGPFPLGTQYTQTSSEKRPEISTRKAVQWTDPLKRDSFAMHTSN